MPADAAAAVAVAGLQRRRRASEMECDLAEKVRREKELGLSQACQVLTQELSPGSLMAVDRCSHGELQHAWPTVVPLGWLARAA